MSELTLYLLLCNSYLYMHKVYLPPDYLMLYLERMSVLNLKPRGNAMAL